MTKEEMLDLRDRIIRGDPPYEVDQMGNRRRHSGTAGLDELKAVGDFGAGAASARLALGAVLQLVDHVLERMR